MKIEIIRDSSYILKGIKYKNRSLQYILENNGSELKEEPSRH